IKILTTRLTIGKDYHVIGFTFVIHVHRRRVVVVGTNDATSSLAHAIDTADLFINRLALIEDFVALLVVGRALLVCDSALFVTSFATLAHRCGLGPRGSSYTPLLEIRIINYWTVSRRRAIREAVISRPVLPLTPPADIRLRKIT